MSATSHPPKIVGFLNLVHCNKNSPKFSKFLDRRDSEGFPSARVATDQAGSCPGHDSPERPCGNIDQLFRFPHKCLMPGNQKRVTQEKSFEN